MGWMMTPDGLNKQDYLEDMKQYQRDMADFCQGKQKLYALVVQYLSDESIEAVQKEAGWTEVEYDANPES
jgi:hypothetical protein